MTARARLHPALSSAGVFALLTLALFGDVLFGGAAAVLSGEGTDIVTYFLPLRAFGFRELRAGSFSLWDPYTYSGTPYAANFQAALFYPPNWLHLVVPAPAAFNAIFALHWFLAAWFTALWCRWRGAGTSAALLGGLVFACSGAFVLRIDAGHVTMFCAAAWIPLILCSVDAMVVEERPRWPLVGILAAAMTLLAGYPQLLLRRGSSPSCTSVATGATREPSRWWPRCSSARRSSPACSSCRDSRWLPAPSPGPSGGVARVLRSTTDELEIEADLAAPAVLLVTDPWAEGWRVTPLSPGPQQDYRRQPADYVLRTVPLAAGRHHLLLHYDQSGLLLGALLSLSSLVGLVAAAFAVRRGR